MPQVLRGERHGSHSMPQVLRQGIGSHSMPQVLCQGIGSHSMPQVLLRESITGIVCHRFYLCVLQIAVLQIVVLICTVKACNTSLFGQDT